MRSAIAESNRAAGLDRLQAFASKAGSSYTKSRNFDFGPGRHGNVSMLSPYVRHRIVLEHEAIGAALRHHAFSSAEKFIQEVFWRSYFKGWLEHRPRVWSDYREDVSKLVRDLETDSHLAGRYSKAISGDTGIECFDAWVSELLSTGYLHNHARMWFASIWVFTLDLPWQLGADLFYRHLLDGDPASNTLSWRWVCGLHTQGKTYLARASNIAKFTDDRFNPQGQLATDAPSLVEPTVYSVQPLRGAQTLPPGESFGLLVTEEDGHAESLLGGGAPTAILGAVAPGSRSPLPIGGKAEDFVLGAVRDAVERAGSFLGVDGEMLVSEDWPSEVVAWATRHRLKIIATAYAPVGPTAELLERVGDQLDRHGITLLQIRRPYDETVWPHAQRGFFKLKQQIPAMLEQIGAESDAVRVATTAG